MTEYYIGITDRFRCVADKCISNCCTGWNINIDSESIKRYMNLEDSDNKKRIISGIFNDNDAYYFKKNEKERCYMLDNDNLCHIQKNYSEKMLCITCRKYPRLIFNKGDLRLVSFSASCPVIAHYLINSILVYYVKTDNEKSFKKIGLYELPWFKNDNTIERVKNYLSDRHNIFSNMQKKYERILLNLCNNYYYYRLTNILFGVSDKDSLDIGYDKEIINLKCETEIDILIYKFLEKYENGMSQDDFLRIVTDSYRDFAHGRDIQNLYS